MIKCPECGQNVSTMAGTCPHCGITIAGNLTKCSNCGEYYLKTQNECPYCKQISDKAAKEETQETIEGLNDEEAEIKEGKKPLQDVEKKGKNGKIFISVIICIILLICGIYYFDRKEQIKREETEYARLENITNPEFYQQFLIDFPDSKYCAEVQERMQRLQDESGDWAVVIKEQSRIALVKFMQSHPYSNRIRICEDMIDSIDWDEARKINTDEAIQNYLSVHPEGRFMDEATAKKNELAKLKITPQEQQLVRGALETFFTNAMSKQDIALIRNAIPEKMSNFCGIENAIPDSICSFAKKKLEKDVMGLHYIVGSEMSLRKEIDQNSNMNFVTSFTLEETINRSDTNQPTNHTYNVKAKLNSEYKIVLMDIK